MKPLIVGEAPGRGPAGPPIEGRIGRRLADLAGLEFDEFKQAFRRVNLLDRWPGSNGKGSEFPLTEAATAADRMMVGLVRQARTVLLLGRRVGDAFGFYGAAYFASIRVGHARFVVLPHPSGVNLWYNDPANLTRMRRFLRRVMREHGG